MYVLAMKFIIYRTYFIVVRWWSMIKVTTLIRVWLMLPTLLILLVFVWWRVETCTYTSFINI
jgi:hypothetical protein